ncbi:transcriptional regulator GutM [Pasteurellaceae bacterium 22721_9_1]
MSATNSLILIAIVAWVLQIILGGIQVSRFNRAFSALSKKGRIGVGRTKGRFKAKVVIAIAFDDDLTVVDALMMKGFTVFSSPQPVPELIGLKHHEIKPDLLFPNNPNAQDALSEAIQIKE